MTEHPAHDVTSGALTDVTIKCVDCATLFVWTVNEQRWMAARHFIRPSRCRPCRTERRLMRDVAERNRR